MKKHGFARLSLLAAALLFAGCGGSDKGPETDAPAEGADPAAEAGEYTEADATKDAEDLQKAVDEVVEGITEENADEELEKLTEELSGGQ